MGARRGTVKDPPWVTNEHTKCNYVRHVTDSSTKAKGWTPAPNNRGTIPFGGNIDVFSLRGAPA
jgi:hypothetical protein